MLALYRAGRQGDALDAYRQAVRTLDAELGLRPWPELERLERLILAQDPELRHGPPAGVEAPGAGAPSCDGDDPVHRSRRLHADAQASWATRMPTWCAVSTIAGCGTRSPCTAARRSRRSGTASWWSSSRPGRRSHASVDIQRAIDRQAHRGPVALAVRVGIGAGDVAWEDADVLRDARRRGPAPVRRRRRRAASWSRTRCGSWQDPLAGPRSRTPGSCRYAGLDAPACAPGACAGRAAARRPYRSAPALASTAPGSSPAAKRELATLRRAWDGRVGRPPPRRLRVRRARDRKDAARGRAGGARAARGRRRAVRALRRLASPRRAAVRRGAVGLRRPRARSTSCGCSSACTGRRSAAGAAVALPARLPGVREPAPDDARHRAAAHCSRRPRRCSRRPPRRRRCCSSSTICIGPTSCRCCCFSTCCAPTTACGLLVVATYRDSEPSRSPLLAERRDRARPSAGRRADGARARSPSADVAAHPGRCGRHAVARARAFAPRPTATRSSSARSSGRSVTATRLGRRSRRAFATSCAGGSRRLPAGAAEVLTSAAVIGPEFDVDVVAAAAGVDVERALDALEAAEQARLVRPAGALDRFAFAHALVRQTIVEDLAGRPTRPPSRARGTTRSNSDVARAPSRRQSWPRTSTRPAASSTPARRCATRAQAGDEAAASARVRHRRRALRARPARAQTRLPDGVRSRIGSTSTSRAVARCDWRATSGPTARYAGRPPTPRPRATAPAWPRPC